MRRLPTLGRRLTTLGASVPLALVLAFSLSSRARADSITFNIGVPNTALSSYTGPYAKVTVDRNNTGTEATITFDSLTNGGYEYLLGGRGAVDVNVNINGTKVTVSGLTGTIAFPPQDKQSLSSTKSGNISQFGKFSNTFKAFDGFSDSYTEISFTLTDVGGTWANASDVLTANALGNMAAVHAFACLGSTSTCTSATATGYAGDKIAAPVPEPNSMALLALGALAMMGFGLVRGRKKPLSD